MEKFQERALAEKEELDVKIEALEKFIVEDAAHYKNLIPAEKADLKTQLSAMNIYSQALERRISRFPQPKTEETE